MTMSDLKLDLSGGSACSLFAKLQQIQQNTSMASSRSSQVSESCRNADPSVEATRNLHLECFENISAAEDGQQSPIEKCDTEQHSGLLDVSTGADPIRPAPTRSEVSGDLSLEDVSEDWIEPERSDKNEWSRTPSENQSLDMWDGGGSQESIQQSEPVIEHSSIQHVRDVSPAATTSTKKAEILHMGAEDGKGDPGAEINASLEVSHHRPPQASPRTSSPSRRQEGEELGYEKGFVKRMKEKHEARDVYASSIERRHRQSSVPLTDCEYAQRDADIEAKQLHAVSLEEKVIQQDDELRRMQAEHEAVEKQLCEELDECKRQHAVEIARLRKLLEAKSVSTTNSLGWRVEGHSEDESSLPSQDETGGVDWRGVADGRGQQLAELRNVVSALEEMIEVERGRADSLEDEVQVKSAQVEELERSLAPLEALRASYVSVLDPSGWTEEWSGREGRLEREDSTGSDKWAAFNAGGLSPICTPPAAMAETGSGTLLGRGGGGGGHGPLMRQPSPMEPAPLTSPSGGFPAGGRSASESPHTSTSGSASPGAQAPHTVAVERVRSAAGSGVLHGLGAGPAAMTEAVQRRAERPEASEVGVEATLQKSKQCVSRICGYLDQLVGAAGASTDFRELLQQLSVLGEELKRRDRRLAAVQSACSCGARGAGARSPQPGSELTYGSIDVTGPEKSHAEDATPPNPAGRPGSAKAPGDGAKADKDRQIRRLEGRVQDLREKMSSHRLKYTKKVTILLAALRDRESQLSSILEQAPFPKSGASAAQGPSPAILSGLRGRSDK